MYLLFGHAASYPTTVTPKLGGTTWNQVLPGLRGMGLPAASTNSMPLNFSGTRQRPWIGHAVADDRRRTFLADDVGPHAVAVDQILGQVGQIVLDLHDHHVGGGHLLAVVAVDQWSALRAGETGIAAGGRVVAPFDLVEAAVGIRDHDPVSGLAAAGRPSR